MIGMIKKPEKIKQLMEVITENNNRYIQRLIDLGVGIGFADPVSSTALISVKQYETFSLPYFQKNVDFIKKQGAGCGLHICGTSRALWELLKKTGIGTFGLDNVEDSAGGERGFGRWFCIRAMCHRWRSCVWVHRRMFSVQQENVSEKRMILQRVLF